MDLSQGNEAIQEFRKLLEENGRQGQADELAALLWYMDGMNRQYEAVLHELQEIRQQLGKEREPAVKYMAQSAVSKLEQWASQIKGRLGGLWEKIAGCAAKAVRDFKAMGVSALDQAVSAIGAKNTLEALQANISGMIAGIKQGIENVECLGNELRSAGSHLKNAGRAMTGREVKAVDGGQEGRFQSTVLAPMRAAQKLLSGMNNATLAAIGNVEHLEEAAAEARAEKTAQRPGKRLEKKPSIRQDLEAKKVEAAAHPAPEQVLRRQEAAL